MSRLYICLISYVIFVTLTVLLLPSEGQYGTLVWKLILGQYLGLALTMVTFTIATILKDKKKVMLVENQNT